MLQGQVDLHVNKSLRFDQCVGVDPAQSNSTLYGGYYTTFLTVFTGLVVQSTFTISDYQEKYGIASSSILR